MAKASLSISIYGDYNGKAMAKCEADLRRMAVTAARQSEGIGNSFVSAGDKLTALGNNMQYTGEKIEAAGMKLTKMTAPIAAVGAAAVKFAADYENSIAKVYTIMDKGVMSTQAMSRSILDLSTETGKSATELAEATYQALSASVATDKVAGFVADAVKLSKAGFTETSTAVDTLTTVINAYGYSADDAEMITNRLIQTQNKGKTTVNELAQSMGNVIPTASAYNVSLDNLCSAYVIMTKQGINTANATTAINGMLTELADEGSNVAGVLRDKTGKSFGQLMADGMDLGQVIQLLSDSVNGDSEAFANLWGNVRASKGALAIANAGASQFTQAMNDMGNSAGLVDAALEDLATPAAKAGKAINALKNTAIDLGEQIIGAAAPTISDLAGKAQELYTWFKNLDDGTKQNIVKFGTLAVAAGPVLTIFGKLYGTVGKLVTGLGHGLQSIGALAAEMKTVKTATTAAVGPTLSYGQAVTKLGREQVPMLTRATNMLKAAQATVVPLAVLALIGQLVGQYQQWKEHAELVAKATQSLGGIMREAESSIGSVASSLNTATEAAQRNHGTVQDCIQAQADLNDETRRTWTDMSTAAAEVDYYSGIIEELGNKGSLTAEEQVRLTDAVEQFNEKTGSSISVINAQTGELSQSKDAIMAVAAAWKEEAKAEALKQVYHAYTEQMIRDSIELEAAQSRLNEADQGFGLWLGDFPVFATEASVKYHEMQQDVRELEAAQMSASENAAAAMKQLEATLPTFDTLDSALASTGASVEQLGAVSDEQLTRMRDSFDGSLKSVVQACANEGLRIPESLANSIMANSGMPQDQQRIMLDALVLQMTGGDVERAATVLGHDIDAGLQSGIEGSSDLPVGAVGILSEEVINAAKDAFQSHSPSQVMHELGVDIDTGLGNGINAGKSKPQSAMASLAALMRSAVAGLPSHMCGVGSSSSGGLAQGVNAGQGIVSSAARLISLTAQYGVSDAPGAFGNTGRNAAGSFAGAIGSSSAYGQGRSLANTANSGLGSVSAWGAGANFTNGFASGLLAAAGTVWARAAAIANNALAAMKSALGIASPSKEAIKVGEFFGQGAVIGMQRMEGAIAAETNRLGDIMTLEPTPYGTFALPGAARVATRAQAGGTTMNVTVNVYVQDASQARQAGTELADGLYQQWKRYERSL